MLEQCAGVSQLDAVQRTAAAGEGDALGHRFVASWLLGVDWRRNE